MKLTCLRVPYDNMRRHLAALLRRRNMFKWVTRLAVRRIQQRQANKRKRKLRSLKARELKIPSSSTGYRWCASVPLPAALPVAEAPAEVFEAMLMLLDPCPDLANCRLVCKDWCAAVRTIDTREALWLGRIRDLPIHERSPALPSPNSWRPAGHTTEWRPTASCAAEALRADLAVMRRMTAAERAQWDDDKRAEMYGYGEDFDEECDFEDDCDRNWCRDDGVEYWQNPNEYDWKWAPVAQRCDVRLSARHFYSLLQRTKGAAVSRDIRHVIGETCLTFAGSTWKIEVGLQYMGNVCVPKKGLYVFVDVDRVPGAPVRGDGTDFSISPTIGHCIRYRAAFTAHAGTLSPAVAGAFVQREEFCGGLAFGGGTYKNGTGGYACEKIHRDVFDFCMRSESPHLTVDLELEHMGYGIAVI